MNHWSYESSASSASSASTVSSASSASSVNFTRLVLFPEFSEHAQLTELEKTHGTQRILRLSVDKLSNNKTGFLANLPLKSKLAKITIFSSPLDPTLIFFLVKCTYFLGGKTVEQEIMLV